MEVLNKDYLKALCENLTLKCDHFKSGYIFGHRKVCNIYSVFTVSIVSKQVLLT